MPERPDDRHDPPAGFAVRRWLPLAAVVLIAGVIFAVGWHQHVSLNTLVRHDEAIHAFIQANHVAAIAAFVAVYVAVVALSLPGALVLTLAGGVLFGGVIGGAAAIAGATAGATLVFLIARSAFGENLACRVGPLADKLAEGFRADAFYYLLFLRLVPVFPFFVVNLVPALVGVRFATFVAATAIGIIPGGFAFAFIGAGLDSVVRAQGMAYHTCKAAGRADCSLDFDARAAITPELLMALAALGVIALVPVIVKRLRARRFAGLSG